MNSFTVRPGIELNDITEESLYGFEFFTFRSPPAITEMDTFIRRAKGKQCFLDVGSNAGLYSCVFQTMNHGQCYAFEPSPVWYKELKYNTQNLNITCNQAALSDYVGELAGHIEDRMFIAGDTELLGIDHTKMPENINVTVTTGDKYCSKYKLNPDVIKIDVEGHEASVLKGLTKTIHRCKPLIFLEVHHDFLATTEGQEDFDSAFRGLPTYLREAISPNHEVISFA